MRFCCSKFTNAVFGRGCALNSAAALLFSTQKCSSKEICAVLVLRKMSSWQIDNMSLRKLYFFSFRINIPANSNVLRNKEIINQFGVKLFKMPLKFVTVNDNVFQLLGHFVHQTRYRGSARGPRWGTSSPRPLRLCSSKISLKQSPAMGKLITLP